MQGELRTIGRYEVVRTLGHGAMGTVYLAEDPMLKRLLAIKVVRAVGEERARALERFKREAEISARLNHPNVVTIYDVGEEPGIGPFLAMEYVEGHSLGRLILDNALDLESKFNVLIQAMRALRAAHRCAIVHRDVKPDNILVSEEGRVKLMDFGIARTMAPRLTSVGEFLGSPAYSAPELLKGQDPTPASDRFAFAATAFELMTGELPHPGENVAAVLNHVLHEPITLPPGVSGPVGAVFRKAMASDPDDRYDSLAEFVEALVDASGLAADIHERLIDTLRQDDHARDVGPIRRMPPRPVPAGKDTGGNRRPAVGTGALRPPTQTMPAIKIELSPQGAEVRSSMPQRPVVPPRYPRDTAPIQPRTLVKWILIVLVVGQVFWWLYPHIQAYLSAVKFGR